MPYCQDMASTHPFAQSAAIFATAVCVGCTPVPVAPAPPPAAPLIHPPEESLALLNGDVFDQVWVIIRDTHPDPTINQGDWNEKRLQFRDRAVAASSTDELRDVLRDMLDTLGESHFAIIPNSVSGSTEAVGGWSGITTQVIDGEVVVVRVAAASPAAAAGVRTGWRVLTAEGDPLQAVIDPFGTPRTSLERLARDRAIDAFMGGRPGMSPVYLFADLEGHEHRISLILDDLPGERATFSNLPPFPAELEQRWLSDESIQALGCDPTKTGRIGYLRFSIWMTTLAAGIDDALNAFRSADGVVIDLRGNPGGLGLMATGVAGHFLGEPTSLGTMRGRDMKLDFRSNPRRVDRAGTIIGIFEGPLAILIDGHTGSTSEIFAAGLLDLKRAQPFGRTSAGAALPATTHTLRNGDVLLHAIGDFKTPSGVLVEGIGVSQQIGTPPTRSDYASSPDPELRDALKWIARERHPSQTP